MDRVLINTAAPIQTTFAVDGIPTDATGNVLVTVTRDDGTVLTAAATATHGGVGVYAFTLTPSTHTGLLDTLTAAWTATIGGVAQTVTTTVEVVGGFHFSIAEARKRLTDTALYPTADLVVARTWAESEIENTCGIAFVPRYASETLNGTGTQRMEPKWPRIRTVRSVVVDGQAADLTGIVIELDRFISRPYSYFRPWFANVVIRYEHGMPFTPPGITAAALDLAVDKLRRDAGQGTIDARAESITTVDGTLRLASAGSGRFGIPTVDAAIEAWAELSVW